MMACTCRSVSHRRAANRSRVGALSPRAISTKGLDILRRVRFAPYRKGHGPTFALTMWDTHRTDSRGSTTVGYRLVEHTVAGKAHVLFAGEDYHGSPMDASDSDANVRGLMEFLTLRPGDTDAEYFANYTPAQLAFAGAHAEALSMAVSDRYPNEQEKRERREYRNHASTHNHAGTHASAWSVADRLRLRLVSRRKDWKAYVRDDQSWWTIFVDDARTHENLAHISVFDSGKHSVQGRYADQVKREIAAMGPL